MGNFENLKKKKMMRWPAINIFTTATESQHNVRSCNEDH